MNHTGSIMGERSVILVHTKQDTSARLTKLAELTDRSKSFLANEEQFVTAVESRIAGLDQGEGISSSTLLDRVEMNLKARFEQTLKQCAICGNGFSHSDLKR